jgi:ADP-L-glycero-D-manno-heptose 6-epimerase
MTRYRIYKYDTVPSVRSVGTDGLEDALTVRLEGHRVAVTGAAGFIGSHVMASLLEAGAGVVGYEAPTLVATQAHRCSSVDQLVEIMAAAPRRFSALIHLGAITDTTCQDLDLLSRVNVELPKVLATAAARAGITFIYASSAAVYGRSRRFTEEPSNEDPASPYGHSKLRLDQWHRRQPWFGRAQVFGLRFFNVYGPGEERKGPMESMVSRWCRGAVRGDAIKIFSGSHGYGDGGHCRDLVYVDDVVRVITHLLAGNDGSRQGGIYNVGTGRATSMLQAATAVRQFAGPVDIEFVRPPTAVLRGYQPFTCADVSKLSSLIPAEVLPSTTIADGVRLTAAAIAEAAAA